MCISCKTVPLQKCSAKLNTNLHEGKVKAVNAGF